MTLIIIGSSIGFIVLFTLLFTNLSPQFGASKKDKKTKQVLNSANYNKKAFENKEETTVMVEFKFSTLKEYFNKDGKSPDKPIPVKKLSISKVSESKDSLTKITWFGHSAILLEMEGKNIFIDPMLGNVPAPLPFLGPKRFSSELPLSADSLPFLDAVLISHDHYDHLDYSTIKRLKDKVGKFYVPLGVGAHLQKWGVSESKILEMDWWDSASIDNIKIVSTPARHFSGRGLNDRNSTLWCSFVIQSNKSNLYFSADGGYGKHFKEIGDNYGPFDYTFMECGQYNEQWAQIHMMPEEVIRANEDLRGKQILPIHWGAFTLALHSWTEPVDRLVKSAEGRNVDIVTPIIGETVLLGEPRKNEYWWQNF